MATSSGKVKYTTPEGTRTWEYLAAFFCSMQILCTGCVIGWNSPSIAKLLAKDSEIPITGSDASTIAACVAVGHMVSPPIVSILLDCVGRKNTILLSGIPLALSWTLVIFAKSAMVLFVARFIAGFFLSFLYPSILYIGEISSAKSRGTTGAAVGLMFNIGILLAFFVGPYLSIRAMGMFCLGLVILFMVCFSFAPKSPYFLVMVGKPKEAEEMLKKLRGTNDVSNEMELIVKSLSKKHSPEEIELRSKEEGSEMGTYKMVYKNTDDQPQSFLAQFREIVHIQANRRAFIIIAVMTLSHYCCGYSIFMCYSEIIFKKMDSPMPAHVVPMVVGLVQLFSSLFITFVVDLLGRRPIILICGMFCTLSLAVIGMYFYVMEYHNLDVSGYSVIPLFASMIYFFAFSCGFLSMQVVLTSEVFATRIKALASGTASIIGGVSATTGLKLYLMIAIIWNIGHSIPFIFFTIFMAAITIILLYILPETKGKTFVQIQEELGK